MYPAARLHVRSIRLKSGEEALLARVVAPDGRIGMGFSLHGDATSARHMAEWHAGLRPERPSIPPGEHEWAKAWSAGREIDWSLEPQAAKAE